MKTFINLYKVPETFSGSIKFSNDQNFRASEFFQSAQIPGQAMNIPGQHEISKLPDMISSIVEILSPKSF